MYKESWQKCYEMQINRMSALRLASIKCRARIQKIQLNGWDAVSVLAPDTDTCGNIDVTGKEARFGKPKFIYPCS